ncbi:DNA-directed RNA polymerase subunit beta' [Erythrobacter sp. EC-HK427]|uniref:DNA-directed RNA polymerase subunit beta' n=1 Tax=Erythrobacter sp. EC-HK427 TaxID=2038396 RepID=UPI00125EDAB3|nr:DNA-directed RNA polymerase subunit beta' [Erythrobacter sp. EC-HK427]
MRRLLANHSQERRAITDKPSSSTASRADLIAALARPPRLGDFGMGAAKAVISLRLVALCVQSGHDPIAVLARRLGGVGEAKAMFGFLDRCGAVWPERMAVHRPCCPVLGPDEATLAAMAMAADAGDHRAFERVLDGFIRPDRREGLFIAAMGAMAQL